MSTAKYKQVSQERANPVTNRTEQASLPCKRSEESCVGSLRYDPGYVQCFFHTLQRCLRATSKNIWCVTLMQNADSFYIVVLNGIIDFLFLVDIMINFRTTYVNIKTGEEITSVYSILLIYFSHRGSLPSI